MAVWVTASLAIILAASEGYLFGLAYSPTRDGVPAIIGSTGLVFALIALVSAAVLKTKWTGRAVAMRVAGNWTAVSGLLLLGRGLR
jgi:hypothetical protein